MKKIITLVLGASENPDRYSNKAVKLLTEKHYTVVAVGAKHGKIGNIEILNEIPENQEFDTITLYINPDIQKDYIKTILNLKPRRVIFNPGTENYEFEKLLKEKGIEPIEACTLVMLRTGQY